MKTEYSVECEVCGSYNISPVKCERCWKKEIEQAEQERILKLIDDRIKILEHGTEFSQIKVTMKMMRKKELEALKKEVEKK